MKVLRKLYQNVALGDQVAAKKEVVLLEKVSGLPTANVQRLVFEILRNESLYSVKFTNVGNSHQLRETHDSIQTLFASFSEVSALYMYLTVAFLGHPDWLPTLIPPDEYIVGHYVESEYLWVKGKEAKVIVRDMHSTRSLSDEPEFYPSIYHLILFQHRRVNEKEV